LTSVVGVKRKLSLIYTDGANIEELDAAQDPHPTNLSTLTLEGPEYEFNIKFGLFFQKLTGRLYAILKHTGSDEIWDEIDLTEESENGIELTPGDTLTIKRRSSIEFDKITGFTLKLKKTGLEKWDFVEVPNVQIKPVGEPGPVKMFKNNHQKLKSDGKIDFVESTMYEFTIKFGGGFEKQTGTLLATLEHTESDEIWDMIGLNQIELTPDHTLTLNEWSSVELEKINKLSIKWIKTGSEEEDVVKIDKVVVKPLGQDGPVKEFTNNKPLVSDEKVYFVESSQTTV